MAVREGTVPASFPTGMALALALALSVLALLTSLLITQMCLDRYLINFLPMDDMPNLFTGGDKSVFRVILVHVSTVSLHT